MALNQFKNLTKDELVFADHYAETGNWSALAKMRELSESREPKHREYQRVLPQYGDYDD